MSYYRDGRLLAGILALVLLVPGCRKRVQNSGDPPPQGNTNSSVEAGISKLTPAVGRAVTMTEMKEFAGFYTPRMLEGMPPKSLEEMPELRQQNGKVYGLIKDGAIVVLWGRDSQRAPNGASNTVLAYSKEVPERGGAVLMLDGSARNMSAEDFKKAEAGK